MGSDGGTPTKSEKAPSPPPPEQNNTHVYPDWPAMQAYYGGGVPLPPAYFNSAVASGHPPHPYMWAQQPMIPPPYGSPYAAIYSHPGMYAHPSVSMGSHGHGIPSSPAVPEAMVATPLSIATPAISPSNKDSGSVKKSKGSNGLAVSIGNDHLGSAGGSQSADYGTEGSSDGSDGSTGGGGHILKKRNCEDAPSTGSSKYLKDHTPRPIPYLGESGEANATSWYLGFNTAADVAGKSAGLDPSRSSRPALELNTPSSAKTKTSVVTFSPTLGAAAPSEHWDERELKRQKRKQSNRESARRSRLRKQAESEELAVKVEALNAENLALRSELKRLTESSEKLRLENAAIMEKLKNAELGQASEMVSSGADTQGVTTPVSTENFLSRVNNAGPLTIHSHQENEVHENSNSGTKLHQLLKSSPRTDAVAAG